MYQHMRAIFGLPGLWLVYLFLIASLGPLQVYSVNLNRIMIGTTVSGILILFAILVSLRMLLAVLFRRPSVTDPLIALLGICGFYNNFFVGGDSGLRFWIWVLFFLLLVLLVFFSPRLRVLLPRNLCIFLGVLNGLVVFNILQHDVWTGRAALRAALDNDYPPLSTVGPDGPSGRPDIYFIVFDRYARADQLAARYDFDNSGFLESLRERGFQVSGRSYSAYQRTAHSLASTLNLDYVPSIEGRASNDWVPLYERLRAPRLYPFLKAAGYRIVTMGSWWEPTRTSPLADQNIAYFAVPESLRPMVEHSMILRGLGRMGIAWLNPRNRQCARIKHKFGALEDAASAEEPVFVFAHFLVPHPPFVIDADGACKTAGQARSASRRDNYIAQLEYTNSAILKLIHTLMDKNPDSVIILQSDEGPWPNKYAGEEITHFGADVTSVDWNIVAPDDLREKMAILNAIYLPGKPNISIKDDFSPVNTFRLILREYFDQPLQDLQTENRVFLSNSLLWQFRDVHGDLTEGEPR